MAEATNVIASPTAPEAPLFLPRVEQDPIMATVDYAVHVDRKKLPDLYRAAGIPTDMTDRVDLYITDRYPGKRNYYGFKSPADYSHDEAENRGRITIYAGEMKRYLDKRRQRPFIKQLLSRFGANNPTDLTYTLSVPSLQQEEDLKGLQYWSNTSIAHEGKHGGDAFTQHPDYGKQIPPIRDAILTGTGIGVGGMVARDVIGNLDNMLAIGISMINRDIWMVASHIGHALPEVAIPGIISPNIITFLYGATYLAQTALSLKAIGFLKRNYYDRGNIIEQRARGFEAEMAQQLVENPIITITPRIPPKP